LVCLREFCIIYKEISVIAEIKAKEVVNFETEQSAPTPHPSANRSSC